MRKTIVRLAAAITLIATAAAGASQAAAKTVKAPPASASIAGTNPSPQPAAAPAGPPSQPGKQPGVTITGKYVPAKLYGKEGSQVLVTIKTDSALDGALLRLQPTAGFTVSPSTFHLPAMTGGRIVIAANVGRGTAAPTTTEGAVMASIESSGKVLETEVLSLEATPGISVWAYLLIGSAGIAVGYVVRMLAKALNDSQPQQTAALAAQPTPKGLQEFVLKHYYWVDFLVTLAIGFIVLASLAKDGRPPTGSVFWSGAFVSGVALGLLTNSELLTRIK